MKVPRTVGAQADSRARFLCFLWGKSQSCTGPLSQVQYSSWCGSFRRDPALHPLCPNPSPRPPPRPNVSAAQLMAFFCCPLTMISRTWVRSIILVSISMMSGCSLAPLMNSSSVSSPADKQKVENCVQLCAMLRSETSQHRLTGAANLMFLTFSMDVDLLVYKSDNILRGNVVSSGDVLNSLY